MTVKKDTEAVVLEKTAEQPIEVVFQDEVQLDINVPLFYIKSGEEEIQAYVNKQAKPQIDDYAASAFSGFQRDLENETEKACGRVAEYVEQTACPAVQSYMENVACPALQNYADQEVKSKLDDIAAAAEVSAREAENYAALAQMSEKRATEQANAAAGSEAEASSSAAEAAVSAFEASDKLLQVQEIAAAMDAENLVHKSGDETLDGVKNFSVSPQVPTPEVASNAPVPATTAWIDGKFQVVSALPEVPDEHVFYFITEA